MTSCRAVEKRAFPKVAPLKWKVLEDMSLDEHMISYEINLGRKKKRILDVLSY